MKKLACFIVILLFLVQASSCSFAKSSQMNPVKIAIKKYKTGNYTGCLQTCQSIVKNDSSNAVAYYYMAMSYVQAGKKDEAIKAYSKVLSLRPSTRLIEYASTGKRCLETPDKCVLETDSSMAITPELDRLISSPFNDGLSDVVRKDVEQRHLNSIKNQINSDKDIDDYQLIKLNDASSQTPTLAENKIASKQPTNDEIVAALKVLNEAGLNPYNQMNNYQDPQMAEINMLNPSNDNNSMSNMLPFMLTQSKYGASNYSPQLMQAVMMNSMMPDLNFNLNKDKDSDSY